MLFDKKKKTEDSLRYFIFAVSLIAEVTETDEESKKILSRKNERFEANVMIHTENDSFPSYTTICRYATDQILSTEAKTHKVVILNCTEVTSKDFYGFLGKYEESDDKK